MAQQRVTVGSRQLGPIVFLFAVSCLFAVFFTRGIPGLELAFAEAIKDLALGPRINIYAVFGGVIFLVIVAGIRAICRAFQAQVQGDDSIAAIYAFSIPLFALLLIGIGTDFIRYPGHGWRIAAAAISLVLFFLSTYPAAKIFGEVGLRTHASSSLAQRRMVGFGFMVLCFLLVTVGVVAGGAAFMGLHQQFFVQKFIGFRCHISDGRSAKVFFTIDNPTEKIERMKRDDFQLSLVTGEGKPTSVPLEILASSKGMNRPFYDVLPDETVSFMLASTDDVPIKGFLNGLAKGSSKGLAAGCRIHVRREGLVYARDVIATPDGPWFLKKVEALLPSSLRRESFWRNYLQKHGIRKGLAQIRLNIQRSEDRISVARSHLEPLIEKQQNNNLKTDDAINLLALENNIAIHENELAVLRRVLGSARDAGNDKR